MLSITFSNQLPGVLKPLVLGLPKGQGARAYGKFLDQQAIDAIDKLIDRGVFKEKAGETLCLYAFSGFEKVILLGLGDAPLEEADAIEVGGKLAASLEKEKALDPFMVLHGADDEVICHVALGAMLRAWRFDTFKGDKDPTSKEMVIWSDRADELQHLLAPKQAVAESVLWSRELVNLPANVLTPDAMIKEMRALEPLGLVCEVLDRKQMEDLSMGALLGVAQGSDNPPYLGILHYKGGTPGKAPLAFVGKGVTFDSGGLSLKPAGSMPEMKGDMGGSAVVLGVMRSLALMKAPFNAVGVVALVENMVSGGAQRPGDIVKSMSGQTIEVLNTDAEGRLILADALYYTHKTFSPAVMVDVATLTGAMRYALGPEYAGLFTPCDKMAAHLTKSGNTVGEKLWRLPLCEAFKKAMESPVADLQNISGSGYGAGSSTAAQFLKCFVGDTPWAHLDIANVDMVNKDTPLATRGGSAFGIRLLCRWALEHAQTLSA